MNKQALQVAQNGNELYFKYDHVILHSSMTWYTYNTYNMAIAVMVETLKLKEQVVDQVGSYLNTETGRLFLLSARPGNVSFFAENAVFWHFTHFQQFLASFIFIQPQFQKSGDAVYNPHENDFQIS